ncbi:MAG: ion channel [Trueperaceae bacterium]
MPLSDIRAFIKRFGIPIVIFSFVIVAGSVGVYLLWRPYNGTWLDAIYMTFITVTTIGFREVHPIEGVGRVLTVTVALTGIGSLFYLFTAVMEFFVAQQLRDPYGRKAMQKQIDTSRNHTIVAGFGRMGKRICEELQGQRSPFVIID